MAEERYNYNMAEAIDKLLAETSDIQDPNSEIVRSLRELANESRAMRAAWEEFAATSGSSSSESSNTGTSTSESSGSADSSQLAANRNTTRRDEAYKRIVEHTFRRLLSWRMQLEAARYAPMDFNAPLKVWTRKDRIIMRNEMHRQSHEVRKKKIIERMVELNNCRVIKRNTEEAKLAAELQELLLQDIFLLRVTPIKDLVFPLSMEWIYDYDKVAEALNGKHTAADCKEFWYTKFHPHANARCWSKAENKRLLALVSQYNTQHWETIAMHMHSDRSAFQCFVQYRRNYYKDPVFEKLYQKKDELDFKIEA